MQVMVTHSLLSAWLYAMNDNPYEDATTEKDSFEDFLKVLRREPTEQTEAMLNGIAFEDDVTRICNGEEPQTIWREPAEEIANIVKDGQLQYVGKHIYKGLCGVDVLLYGRLDCLKAGKIYDIKFSKSYERGKYLHSTQHPAYFELVPEADEFIYLVFNGKEVLTESYRREETTDIRVYIESFFEWLKNNDLWGLYCEKWQSKY